MKIKPITIVLLVLLYSFATHLPDVKAGFIAGYHALDVKTASK